MFRKCRFILGSALTLIIFFLAAQVSADAATVRLTNPRVEVELKANEVYSGEIVAENPTEEEVSVKIYLEDWVYAMGGTGEKEFKPMGTTPYSASRWIDFSPTEDVIKPFGRTVVRYTIKVPEDVKGAYYSVLFFETALGIAQNEEGANVMVTGRIGSLFFIRIKGEMDVNGVVKSVDVKPSKGNAPLEILTVFENTGNTDIPLGGNFLIMDKEGKVAGRGDLKKIYTFPGATETSRTEWVGRLSKGGYDLLLTYDLGNGKNIVEERTFTVD